MIQIEKEKVNSISTKIEETSIKTHVMYEVVIIKVYINKKNLKRDADYMLSYKSIKLLIK